MTREHLNRNASLPHSLPAARLPSRAPSGSAREHVILGSLLALFDLAQRGIPADETCVAGRLGVSEATVHAAFTHLESRGLVDVERARLTLRGLTIASALRAARERTDGALHAA